MNKRHLNIALIVLVTLIWGSVIYKYFGGNASSIKQDDVFVPMRNFKLDYSIAKDTFQLKLNEDPFKISGSVKKAPQKLVTKSKPTSKPVIKTPVSWPEVTYHGFVKGESKTTRLVLLKVNNRIYKKRENQTVNELVILKAYDDSLVVSLQNNKKTIKKQ